MDSEYGNLWSYWGSRPWHLLLVIYDALLVIALVWWIRREIHKTLPTSPAMAAGSETRLWAIQDVVVPIDEQTERNAPRLADQLVG